MLAPAALNATGLSLTVDAAAYAVPPARRTGQLTLMPRSGHTPRSSHSALIFRDALTNEWSVRPSSGDDLRDSLSMVDAA
ncbi:hypothetical protein ACFW2Y_27735 [Streptomyces sp. NPDC058877]|uniref:hypothetical protein n=1 Tax=Streptomyces sp. NPDC058877 TaxID=3346665 RepID=UPI0036C16747